MKFCEFLNMLKAHSARKNQSQFVLEIFSAICGEENPLKENKQSKAEFLFSECLPVGLTGEDHTYRKRLYGARKEYDGLSTPIKNHILSNANEQTFISYCEKVVSDENYRSLCDWLKIDMPKMRTILFSALYHQFLEFARQNNDDVPYIIHEYIASQNNVGEKQEITVEPFYQDDDIQPIESDQTAEHFARFYEHIKHTFIIKNAGDVPWKNRHLAVIDPKMCKMKAIPPTIEIPTTDPGNEISITAIIDVRGIEGEHEIIFEMKDAENNSCFPNKEEIFKILVTVINE